MKQSNVQSVLSATLNKENNSLLISVPLSPKGTISKSGKSQIIATTNGNQQVVIPEFGPISIGVNAYQYLSR